jgi:hypothetical protein
MAKLTISDAARGCRVARSTLQRAINAGRLSVDPDHRVDTAELMRAGYTLHAARQDNSRRPRQDALQDAAPTPAPARQDAAGTTPPDAMVMQHTLAALERENALLHAALDAAAAREQEAHASAQAAREERALLLQMLHEMQHRYDRLLDMPRPPAPLSPQNAPGPSQGRTHPQGTPPSPDPPQGQPGAREGDARGAMRRRIVALLQDHPEGLTPAQMQTLLGVERSLADTALGMLRYGLVQRVGYGRYGAAEPRRRPTSERKR